MTDTLQFDAEVVKVQTPLTMVFALRSTCLRRQLLRRRC